MTAVLAAATIVAVMAAAYAAFADAALLAVDEEEPPSAIAAEFVARREAAHRALAFARILSLLLGGAAAAAALDASDVPPVQVGPLVVVAGALVVMVAESTARARGARAAADGIASVAPGVRAVEWLLAPVVWLGARADLAAAWLFPAGVNADARRESTVEQYREAVAAEVGASADEQRLLRGVFSLAETPVLDIMVPRVDVVGVSSGNPWGEVVEEIRAARHARFPVYDGTLDNVVGILYAKDLLPSVLAGAEPPGGWPSLARPAQFIPGTKAAGDQLRDFRVSGFHMAIVVDEFGGTAGVITLEDALEVIVGEIRDEHDVEEAEVRELGEGRFSVSGRVPIDHLSELVGVEFSRDGVHTVGGLMYAAVGGVPKQGEGITIGGFRFVIERVLRRRIVRVRVERVGHAT